MIGRMCTAMVVVASALVVSPAITPAVVEAQTGASLVATKNAPGQILAGEAVPYGVSVRNSGSAPLFNLSFRDELPLGATYVPPTAPGDFGEPEIIVNQVPDPLGAPGTTIPQQTLIWSNVADLQPGSSIGLSFSVELNPTPDAARPSLPVYVVGSTVDNSASVFGSPDERTVPRFDAAGLPITDPAVVSSTTATVTIRLSALDISKSEPSPEGELLRGVHEHTTVYTIEVRTTDLAPVVGATVTDLLPAGLEFLGCGGVDNSTDAGGQRPEYPGAPLLTGTPTPGGCRFPDVVETVLDPAPDGTTVYPPGVYTRLTWNLAPTDTEAGDTLTLRYAAGIPLRENVLFPPGTPTDGLQASNLDNNTGPSTREGPAERAVTNVARVAGTYTGPLAPGATADVSDDVRLSRSVEDVRMRKSIVQPTPNDFRTGALAVYELTVDVSEYVDASSVVITDEVPNGLCPISNVAYTSTGGDCGAAFGSGNPNLPRIVEPGPSPFGFASVTPTAGGGFTVVFPPLPDATVEANDTVRVQYTALMRTRYEGGALDGRPPVSGDSFTNGVRLQGTTTPIPDTPETGPQQVTDGSSATLVSGGTSIDKRLQPRPPLPVTPGTPCPTDGADYVDETTSPQPTPADLAFRLGDEVCFLLRVDFDENLRTRNAVVTDFLPIGLEYVQGSILTTAAHTGVDLNLGGASLPLEGPLVLNVGTDDPAVAGSDRFVDLDAVMEIVFKAVVVDIPDDNRPIISGNLMKMRIEDSSGRASSFRDRVGLGIVPAPPMLLTKGVSSVDTPAFSTTQPNQDGVLVQQGSQVTYRLDLTNAGTAANFNAYSTRGFEVWDVLPVGIDCADVVAGSITAFGETGLGASLASCTDPGQLEHPSFDGNTVRSAIRWDLATDPFGPDGVNRWTIDAGASETLTYQIVIPSPTSIGVTFVNNSAIRSYEAFTNQTNVGATYFPADNIDTTVTPQQENAPAAADPSSVRTPGAVTTKTTVTGIEELPNNDLPRVAVPGETITYTIGVEIPPAVSVFEATLRDLLPNQVEVVAPAVARFYPDASDTTTPAPSLPPGFVFDPNTGTLTFPRNPDPVLDTGYSNDTTTTQRFEVVLTVRVRPTIGNQTTINNTARFTSVDRPGGRPVNTDDATAQNDIRQASPSVVKSNDSGGTVRAGQTVRYTLQSRNANGRPPAHDAVVRDCIPDGLLFVAFDPSTPPGTTSGPAPGAAANGCPVGSTFISFDVGTVAAGSPVNRSYTVTVQNTAVGGASYTNRAAIVASSLDNGTNDETVERVYRPNEVTNTVRVPPALASKTVTPTQATVGELVTYTASDLIPRSVNFFQAALRDILPVGIDPATLVVLDTTCQSIPNAAVPAPPPCDLGASLLTPASVPGGLAVATYFGDLAAVPYDRIYTVRYQARLADVPSNLAGADVVNRAQAVWDLIDRDDPVSADFDWQEQGDEARAVVEVIEPSLTLAKSVSDTTPEPGDLFIYTLDLTNATGATVSPGYNVTVVDDVPVGIDIVPGSFSVPPTSFNPATAVSPGTITWGPDVIPGPIEPGGIRQVSYTARFTESATLASTAKVNTARLRSYEGLPADEPAGLNRREYTGNDDDASVTPRFPRMQTTKVATGGEPTYIGDSYRWTVTATNVGDGTARGVSIEDLLPPNWSYLDGSGIVTFPSGDAVARNPLASPLLCEADRLCWFGLGDLAPGQSITLSYLAVPGTGVVIAPGVGSATRHVNAARSDAADATGATSNLDGPYGSPDATASTRIDAVDLVLEKSSPPNRTPPGPPPVAGREFSWQIDVRNSSGVDTAVGPFVVTDTLPPAPDPLPPGGWITFDRAGGTGWACSPGGGAPSATSIRCERNNPAETLAPGASFEPITVTVDLPSTLPLGTPMTNSASVTSRTYELVPADNTDTDTVSTATQADLSIVKNRTNAAITAGRTTTYTLDVANLGPSVSRTPITVTDPIPTNATLVDVDPGPGWSCPDPASGDPLVCTYGADLAVGEVAPQIAVTVLVDSDATGTLTNTATVTGTTIDPNQANNSSANIGPIGQSADLRIDKQSVESTNVAGLPTQYRLRVDNDGPSDAVDLVISDPLPDGLTFVSAADAPSAPGGWSCAGADGGRSFTCTLPSLAAGDFAVVVITVAVEPGLTGDVENTASVASPTPDPNLSNNSDNDVATVLGEADLAITKVALETTVIAGENITYTLQVVNNGPSDSVGPIRVSDTLPPGVEFVSAQGAGWACPTALLAGATVTCTRAATLPAATVGAPTQNVAPPISLVVRVLPEAGPGRIDNTAVVTTTTKDPELGNNVDRESVEVDDLAELGITKTTTGPDPVLAGETTSFTIVVTNDGPSVADSVIVADPMPSGLSAVAATGDGWVCGLGGGDLVTCVRPTLAPGDAPPIVVTAAVAPGVPNDTLITNLASVDSATPELPDGDPGSLPNTSEDTVLVLAEADLAITKSHDASVRIGEELTFTIEVVNNGPSASRGVIVADTFPAGLVPLRAEGEGWTCTIAGQQVDCELGALLGFPGRASIEITALVEPEAFPAVTNIATVDAETEDPVDENNSSEDPVEVPALVDLTIAKTHAAAVAVGQPIVYTLVVGNDGPIDDTATITVADTLPDSLTPLRAESDDPDTSCSIAAQTVTCERDGGLAVGDTFSITISATVLPAAFPLVVNTAMVSTPTDDVDPSNNSSTDRAVVPPLVDLVVTKTHGGGTVQVGGTLTYTIVVTNNGPTPEPGPIVVEDTLPTGLSPVSASGDGLECAIAGPNVRCTSRAALGVGGTLTLRIVAEVGPAAFPSVTNVVTVASPGCTIVAGAAALNENCRDTDLANNRAVDVAPVAPLILLELTKSLAAQEGRSATWDFVVRNTGLNATVEPIVLTDPLPAGLAFVSAQGVGWACTNAANVVTCTYVASVPAGAVAPTLQLSTALVAVGGTEIVNLATVEGGGPQVPSDNDDAVVVAPPLTLPSTGGGPGLLLSWAPLTFLLGVIMVAVANRRRQLYS
jgi:uncharacterized repeat protein (TIGR01451 family)